MDILKDLAYAARLLRKNLAFAVTAIVTIALGIGASTAIFSVVNAVLLRPLPYSEPDRLTLIWGDMRARNVVDFPFPPGDVYDLRQQTTSFEDIAAVSTFKQSISGDDVDPAQVIVGGVTTNFFSTLGARVAQGREFIEADGIAPPQPPPVASTQPAQPPTAQQPGQRAPAPAAPRQPAAQQPAQANQPPQLPTIVILSNEFWQRRYGGDPGVIGRNIDVGGQRSQVVGVLAPGFELLFPPGTNIERAPDIWAANRIDFEGGSRLNVFLRLIGRLNKGATIQQARTQVEEVASDLRQRFPIKQTSDLHFRVEPMQEDLIADVRPAILALMGAVIFVLLIACANIANLLLVRASWREREFAVRAALGGSRWRLVRQMLAESLLIAGGGAVLGILLAQLGIDLLSRIRPDNLPRIESIRIDRVVLAFTALATIVAAAAFGILPALRASRPNVMEVLRRSGRTSGLAAGRILRNSVVMAEVALSFVLLIGCGLMLRSFVALNRADPGYDPNKVLTFFLPNTRARGSEARAVFMREMHDRLQALPGVLSVTAATPLPLDGQSPNSRWGTDEALADPSKFQQANAHFVLPGYFETLGTRLIDGRTFTEADNRPDAKGIVIDRLLAAKAFPNESAVGKRLIVRIRSDNAEPLEVIGVVAHQRHTTLAADGREAIFFADGFMGHGRASRWALRTDGDPMSLVPAVRAEIARMDPLLAVAEVQPMLAFVDRARAQTRFALVLISIFAVIAAVLAAVGLYGVLSTVVRMRTSEIGVRMALGATPGNILRLMVGQGMRLSIAGVEFGLLAALGLTRAMTTMLVEVKPTDPPTFAVIAVVFIIIAAIASWLPARRAAKLDPTTALRDE
ncbi:MAG TPA: ABC transporter permease [Blastocatellia bacterium]|nr:ABC transporter permease [Blastocatellia bacterium]